MKKLLVFALSLCCVGVMAQDAVITFTETSHDFGRIPEEGGKVTHVFEFKNEGMSPLTLTNVRASCGCTTPNWTKSPVGPGETGVINVTYNPNGRPGKFSKTITVTSNAKEPTLKLYISGEVIPKSAKPADKYKVKMGNLNVSQKDLNFNEMRKTDKDGETKTQHIQYANNTDKPVKVTLLINEEDQGFVIPEVSLSEIAPNQEDTISITLLSEKSRVWGPISTSAYVVIDGVRDEANKINIKANIVEDFSVLTDAERKNAPILELPNEINLGSVQAGATVKTNVKIKNAGNSSLLIRRVVNNDKKLRVTSKSTLKAGKSGSIAVTLDAVTADGKPLEKGDYSRQITLITNDPQNNTKKINIVWKVQ